MFMKQLNHVGAPVRSEKPVKAPKLTKKDEKALAKLVAGIQPYIEASAQADPPIVASTFAEVKVGRWWYDVLASISHDDSGNALVKYGRKGKGESALATIKPMFFSSHLR